MSVLLKSIALLLFCLLPDHEGRKKRTVRILWKVQTDFKSCFINCFQDSVCASFKFKPKTGQCRAYPGSAFNHGPGRKGVVFHFCKSRICRANGYTLLGIGSMCIRVDMDPANWGTSRKLCRNEHADLVVINSKAKQKFVQMYLDTFDPSVWKKMLKGRRLWVGLRRKGKFRYGWINGKSRYQGWGPGDPSYGDEACAMLTTKGLADVRCGTTRFYICQLF